MPPQPTKCVYCRTEPVAERYRPFCSERCKMSDLGRWLKGDYAVPAKDQPKLESDELDLDIEDL